MKSLLYLLSFLLAATAVLSETSPDSYSALPGFVGRAAYARSYMPYVPYAYRATSAGGYEASPAASPVIPATRRFYYRYPTGGLVLNAAGRSTLFYY